MFKIPKSEVINIFNRHTVEHPVNYLPPVLSFDEKYLNKNICENGYSFVIVDWFNVKIIDMINSRHINKLSNYFSKIKPEIRAKVKYITMDMYETYLNIAKIYFNNAIIAIDSFHVLQNLNRAFEAVRQKYIRKYKTDDSDDDEENPIEYYVLKKYRDSFYKLYDNLDTKRTYNKKFHSHMSERDLVDYGIRLNHELYYSYSLSQKYLEFNMTTTQDKAEKELDELIELFYDSNIKPYVDFSKTLSTWKEYILNSFIRIYDHKKKKKRRLSDGPIEGLNSQIEKIYINGNGYQSFKNFKKVVKFKINKDFRIHIPRHN